MMKIYIKNMVCQGTRRFVLMEIKKLGLNLKSFDSGELDFQDELSPSEEAALEFRLGKYGLETARDASVPLYTNELIATTAI